MASSSNQSQESRTQTPSGESAPVSSTNFKNQKQSGPSVPLSPQLRYSLSRVSPPSSTSFSPSPQTVMSIANGSYHEVPSQSLTRVSPPSSSSFSPSPQTVASIANGSYHKFSSKWCPDNSLWSGGFNSCLYLSRNSLLKKMFHRRAFTRLGVTVPDIEEEQGRRSAILLHRSLEECWETYPIQLPIRLGNAELPTFDDCGNEEPYTIAYVNLPVKSTRDSIKQQFGERFLWVTNTTGTKFLDRWSFSSRGILFIPGYGECPVCGGLWLIKHLVPKRFELLDFQLVEVGEKINQVGGEAALQSSLIACRCDGNLNPLRPIISDNPNKINWLFLFLGFEIGLCTIDQLKYYCIQRMLPISDNKGKIVVTVFDDLCHQIFLRRFRA